MPSASRPSNHMVVRRAGLDDAKAIATIHVQAWQTAYQGIVPSAVLESLSVEQREALWRHTLERKASETWVADDDDHVVGGSAPGGAEMVTLRPPQLKSGLSTCIHCAGGEASAAACGERSKDI